jgi:hypothetical protein
MNNFCTFLIGVWLKINTITNLCSVHITTYTVAMKYGPGFRLCGFENHISIFTSWEDTLYVSVFVYRW